jgi:hypothetical protein
MKMKMNMVLVAGALALSMAGQANATIVTGGTGASDMILTVWDSANNTSYTADLGINMSSFLSGVSATSSTAVTATGANAMTVDALGNHTFAADATLTSYLSTLPANASLVWNVTAVDNFQTAGGFQQKQLLVTTNTNIKSAANSLSTVSANTQVGTAIANWDTYLTGVNLNSGAATSMTAGAADAWLAKPNQLNTFVAFTSTAPIGTAALGSTMNFWYVTPSSIAPTGKASVAQFQGNGTNVATWTLASNGNLTYSVGAVPEPGEWLLMLSGLGLIGFIATRRKNAGSMTFA